MLSCCVSVLLGLVKRDGIGFETARAMVILGCVATQASALIVAAKLSSLDVLWLHMCQTSSGRSDRSAAGMLVPVSDPARPRRPMLSSDAFSQAALAVT